MAFKTTYPSEFSMTLRCEGMDIFWNLIHTLWHYSQLKLSPHFNKFTYLTWMICCTAFAWHKLLVCKTYWLITLQIYLTYRSWHWWDFPWRVVYCQPYFSSLTLKMLPLLDRNQWDGTFLLIVEMKEVDVSKGFLLVLMQEIKNSMPWWDPSMDLSWWSLYLQCGRWGSASLMTSSSSLLKRNRWTFLLKLDSSIFHPRVLCV